jgi:hypothetical protein
MKHSYPLRSKTNRNTTATTTPQNIPCYISSIPNEILSKIFSYLPNPINIMPTWPKFSSSTKSERLKLQPVLVIRQVCSHFRSIANNLPFWYKDTFEPTSLIANFSGEYPLSTTRLQYQPTLSPLFESISTDQELVSCLARKQHWIFHEFHTYSLIVKAIPLLQNTITRLSFVPGPGDSLFEFNKSDEIPKLVKDLGRYPALRELTLGKFNIIMVDLDPFGQACPELSVFRFTGNSYQAVFASWHGFSNLRELVLKGVARDVTNDWDDLDRLPDLELPTLSADSLRVLELHDNSYNLNTLSLFTNLSSLHLVLAEEASCKAIITANFNLTQFGAKICYRSPRKVTLDMITSVLMAQSLSNVEHLSLDLDCGVFQSFEEWMEAGCCKFVEAISLNLKCLQHIQFKGIPIRIKSFQPLSRLYNIKSVLWMGRLLDIIDTTDPNRKRARITKAMDAVFLEFQEKPKVKVMLFGRDRAF